MTARTRRTAVSGGLLTVLGMGSVHGLGEEFSAASDPCLGIGCLLGGPAPGHGAFSLPLLCAEPLSTLTLLPLQTILFPSGNKILKSRRVASSIFAVDLH